MGEQVYIVVPAIEESETGRVIDCLALEQGLKALAEAELGAHDPAHEFAGSLHRALGPTKLLSAKR